MYAYYIYFLIIYFIIDMIWITLSSKFHKVAIEKVQNRPLKVDMVVGAVYYLIVSFLIIYIISSYTKTSGDALRLGTMLAILMFVTFDLTNKTIFTNYPYWYVAMDIVGGVSSLVLSLYLATALLNMKLN